MKASSDLLPAALLDRAYSWNEMPFGEIYENGTTDSESYSYDLRAIIKTSESIDELYEKVVEFIQKLDNDPEGHGCVAANQIRVELSNHGFSVPQTKEQTRQQDAISRKASHLFRRR